MYEIIKEKMPVLHGCFRIQTWEWNIYYLPGPDQCVCELCLRSWNTCCCISGQPIEALLSNWVPFGLWSSIEDWRFICPWRPQGGCGGTNRVQSCFSGGQHCIKWWRGLKVPGWRTRPRVTRGVTKSSGCVPGSHRVTDARKLFCLRSQCNESSSHLF